MADSWLSLMTCIMENASLAFWWKMNKKVKTMLHDKMLDLVVNQPAVPLFDPLAQKVVALGVVAFLLMWGTAKIVKAWRK